MLDDTRSLVPCPASLNVVNMNVTAAQISTPANWVYATNSIRMAPYLAVERVRFFTSLMNVNVLTMVRHSAMCSSPPVSVSCVVTSQSWPMQQMDVKNAFLHSRLQETVYCQQLSSFVILLNAHIYVLSTNQNVVLSKFLVRVFNISLLSSTYLVLLPPIVIPRCLSYTLIHMQLTYLY